MKLLEIIESITNFKRIRRTSWKEITYLVRGIAFNDPMVQINMHSLQMGKYMFTYEDLVADDWEVI